MSGTPYTVPYRIRPDRVELIAVLHGAQQWPDSFPQCQALNGAASILPCLISQSTASRIACSEE